MLEVWASKHQHSSKYLKSTLLAMYCGEKTKKLVILAERSKEEGGGLISNCNAQITPE